MRFGSEVNNIADRRCGSDFALNIIADRGCGSDLKLTCNAVYHFKSDLYRVCISTMRDEFALNSVHITRKQKGCKTKNVRASHK